MGDIGIAYIKQTLTRTWGHEVLGFLPVGYLRLPAIQWFFVLACAFVSYGHAAETTSTVPRAGLEIILPAASVEEGSYQQRVLSPQELAELPISQVVTSTIVTDGVITFIGVLMRDVFEHLEYVPEMVTATALNDYEIDIPAHDFMDYDVLLAWQADGEVLTEHDKGPFWIIYPRDDYTRLQDIRYDYRWVWQLFQLTLH